MIDILKEYRGIPLCFLGLGIDRAWRASVFYYGAFPTIGIIDYYIFGAALALTGLIAALASKKFSFLHLVKAIMPGSCLAMIIGSMCVVVACFVMPSYPLKIVGLVLMGISDGILYLLWAEFFGQLKPVKVTTYFALAVLFGELFKFFFMGLDAPYHAALAIGLPVVSFLCIKRTFSISTDARIGEIQGKKPFSFKDYPWKAVLLIALCFFLAAFDASQVRPLNVGNTIGSVLVPLGILIVLSANQKVFKIQSLNQVLFPLFIASFLLLLPVENLPLEFESFRNEAAYTMLFMLILVVLSSVSWHFKISAVSLSGIERFVRFIFEFAGFALSIGFLNYTSPEVTGLAYFVFEVLMLSSIFIIFFTKRGLFAKWDFEMQIDHKTSQMHDESQRLESMANDHYLSAREKEVFLLLVQGYTTSQIAEMLYAAPGTIKAHLNHIYGKFNVHSKSELIDIVRKS